MKLKYHAIIGFILIVFGFSIPFLANIQIPNTIYINSTTTLFLTTIFPLIIPLLVIISLFLIFLETNKEIKKERYYNEIANTIYKNNNIEKAIDISKVFETPDKTLYYLNKYQPLIYLFMIATNIIIGIIKLWV